jgi:hypothetical protein
VHYHLVAFLPLGWQLPKLDKQKWWRHGSTQMQWGRKPVAYIAKYASKLKEHEEFPKGLRMHGRGGMSAEVSREVRYWVSPRYVREAFGPGADPARAQGGGWINNLTGEWIESRALNEMQVRMPEMAELHGNVDVQGVR